MRVVCMCMFHKCNLTLTGQHLLTAEQKAIMMFKIVNHFIDTPGSSLLQLFIIQEATIGYSHKKWQELILITFIFSILNQNLEFFISLTLRATDQD